ncbi:D-glycero-alpha-D-manno-heptose-1,7-bisphosphate 7-phosphatase [Parafrigoribacterium soli]|uniref:D-glycero-alpha-D-manno-heptose-1,7-bisphosphate 7-phosphatase n=1 Tax=Parafrigoribacterium soli TaxID=3144663 RepID=UPI0032EDE8CC
MNPSPTPVGARRPPLAVLFDRDGTLVVDVPYNGDPARVVPMPTSQGSLALLRSAGIALGVVTNQSGIARGILDRGSVDAVNERIERLLGHFDVWCVCPHGPEELCSCRKPLPGMILDAARELGFAASDIAVIGDIGSDMDAAKAAGARGVLVPTPRTLQAEVDRAAEVAPTIAAAVELLLSGAEPNWSGGEAAARSEARP